ncbi:MAG: transporter permease, partial [Haloplasmataceae bacterium]|nr:transporter permease [Haloplasmataceae bacterium]
MNKIVSIAFFEIKKNVRDIKMLLLLVVTPIITIFILGKSLDAFLTMESMPTPLVGYVNHDEGNLSDSFDSFIKSNEIKDIIEILEYETQEEAAVALEKGNVNCIIFINNNFSKLLTDGNT